MLYHGFWGITAAVLIETFLVLFVKTYHFDKAQISRGVLVYHWLIGLLLIILWRILFSVNIKKLHLSKSRLLIVGCGEIGKNLMTEINAYSELGHEVIGFVDDDIDDGESGIHVLGKTSDLPDIVEKNDIDEIIIASSKANRSDLINLINLCKNIPVILRILPDLYEILIGDVEVEQIAGIPLIEIKSERFAKTKSIMKRIIDIVVSVIIVLVTTPLWLIIAFAIKCQSKGTVLYKQKRVGKNGKEFTLFKFRTMVQGAEKNGPTFSFHNDPRVTKVGRFLRRCYLDELPQIWNVIKGDMSLVGPRPERPVFVQQFKEECPYYEMRLKVKPGITGLAQIHGYYDTSVANKLRYDVFYINNMSLLLDLKILFLTLKVALTGRRA